MKQVTMKTERVATAWRVLSAAKLSKLEDTEKVRVWKATRAMKQVAEAFDEASQDAAKRLQPTEDFADRLEKAREYERIQRSGDADAGKLPMGPAEHAAFVDEWNRYNRLVQEAVGELADKEVELEIETLTEEGFGRLMASNDWTLDEVGRVDFIVE